MRGLYTLALRLAAPAIAGRLWWRGRREPLYRRFVGQRFGWYAGPPGAASPIWLHAVSVGEARAAAPLVRALREALPGVPFLVTTMTAAGRATAAELFGDAAELAWLPYDYPGATRRFLRRFRPRLAILMETELWPNLLAACAEAGLPVLLANARLSEKSARGYARWSRLTAPGLGSLAAVLAQSEDDARRLRAVGAARVSVAGNLKFDATPDARLVAAGRAWRARLARPVLLLASTREGEETLLLDALPRAADDLLVVVVPRHPQRFADVARLAQSRRSQGEPAPADRVHLGDTMGEMAFYFAACDVAVIGGSFLPLGGQNLIEALAVGAPVVLGPHMFNFAEATRLALAAGAAVQCADAPQALAMARQLLGDPARRERMAQAGQRLCAEHRGATARHLAACLQLLEGRR